MGGTYIFLMIVIIIACILLILVVLSQNPKGGGLSSTFGGGGGQMFGVERTTNFMDKATWTLAGFIAVMIIVSVSLASNPSKVDEVSIPAANTEATAPPTAPADKKEPTGSNAPAPTKPSKTPLPIPNSK